MGKKGFTLIEIIIVIVILGVMATLALPRLTAQIEGANAAEAMNMFGTIKSAAINCYDMSSDATACYKSSQIGVTASSGKFNYGSVIPTGATTPIWFKAIKSGVAITIPCTASNACIFMAVNPVTGAASFTLEPSDSTNPYYGIVQKIGSSNPGAVLTPASYAAF